MGVNRGEPLDGDLDYRTVSREGWDVLSLRDDPVTFDPSTARTFLDPFGWISWDEIQRVLCLAAGGGEQAPRFAALGCTVTVVDISRGQLERDREVASEMGLTVECVEADMLDLEPLHGRQFDLVYQPASAFYGPDVALLYRQVATVTRPGGSYMVQHLSPAQLQLAHEPWDGAAYRIGRPLHGSEPLLWQSEDTAIGRPATSLHYLHPLGALIGGLCESGFDVVGFNEPDAGDATAEPGSEDHLAAYIAPYFWVFARRRG